MGNLKQLRQDLAKSTTPADIALALLGPHGKDGNRAFSATTKNHTILGKDILADAMDTDDVKRAAGADDRALVKLHGTLYPQGNSSLFSWLS